MSDSLRIVVGVVVFAALIAVVWTFQAWRDRRLIEITAEDGEFERVRASRIAVRIGTFVIWVVTAGSGVVTAISLVALCAGLFTGFLGVADAVYLVGGFAIAGLIYLWSDRILNALP